ncbi:MAG: hypothetical protein S4CHLAM20_10910 [Chlamydiia bacterium]|nr:hypothetical protein [Chlamydiia bacterium]
MENKNILISGAGPAGLSIAYWLKKYGFNPTIIERFPKLRTGGYKIDIRGTAMEVIKRMGIHDEIYENRTDIKESKYVSSDGKILGQAHPDEVGIRTKDDLEIVRGTLCKILYDKVQDVEVIFDDSISQITQTDDGVVVQFKKGESREFDLMIGADGLHSKTRDLVFGEEENYLKQLGNLYISFYSVPNYLNLDRVEFEFHKPPRFGILYCPIDGEAKVGFAFSSDVKAKDLQSREKQQELITKLYENAGWEFPKLLSFIKDSPDFYFDTIAQIHMKNFTKGRTALIGDCGYCASPLSGQGTSLALVGSYILAGELYKSGGDYKKAFVNYEEVMREFISENQRLAEVSVKLFQGKSPSIGMTVRALFMKLCGKKAYAKWIEHWKKIAVKEMHRVSNLVSLKNY